MLKFWFELFGFDIEHGFACWDVGTAVGVGASVIGGISGDNAASDAANAQTQASEQATAATIAEQRREYDLNRSDLTPGRNLYTGASNALGNYLGLSMPNSGGSNGANGGAPLSFAQWQAQQPMRQQQPLIQNNSALGLNNRFFGNLGAFAKQGNQTRNVSTGTQNGYQNYLNSLNTGQTTQNTANFGEGLRHFDQNALNNDVVYQNGLNFGLDQGAGAIDARARASGSSDSGSVLKDLVRFANDYGSTKANDSYNRFNTTKQQDYGFLSGAAGLGQNSANATVQSGQNASNNISNALLANGNNVGNARSAGIVGGANAWSNALGGIANQNWGDIFKPKPNYTGYNSGTNSYYSG